MLRYLHFDVFTDHPFEGNQLAVFPEPGGLSAAQMQSITREMNFSECTFIFPRQAAGDVRMRIFTPGSELPIAGHPTIGSTFALALEGVIARGRESFVFELNVGPTPVTLEWAPQGLAFAWMTQPLPAFGAQFHDAGSLAAAVGLTTDDLLADVPAQIVSCGVPFLFVPIASRAAVDAVTLDRRALVRCLENAGSTEVPAFLFTPEGGEEGTVYSRMLAPGFGVPEDPATGAASGPLGCYLLQHRLVTSARAQQILSIQGVAMRRPSRVHIAIDSAAGAVTRVRVGGQATLVGRGELLVP